MKLTNFRGRNATTRLWRNVVLSKPPEFSTNIAVTFPRPLGIDASHLGEDGSDQFVPGSFTMNLRRGPSQPLLWCHASLKQAQLPKVVGRRVAFQCCTRSGSTSFSAWKRRKSLSVEYSVAPCSSARAAKAASVISGPLTFPSATCSENSAQKRSP